jgi:hypothetical protein
MTTQLKQRRTATTTIRTGDVLVQTTVTTEVESVYVDFDDILAAVEVSPDDSMNGEAPWDWCDGYVHTVERVSRLDEARDKADLRRGYCYSDGHRERIIITAQWDDDLYRWHRDNGASRQVAREMVALSMRKRLDQLVKWYTHDWEWWYCGGDYKGCADGVGGIDDYDYAHDEVRRECAENIAHQLEQAGYIVAGRPTPNAVDTRQQKRDRFRRNRTLFSWND